MAERVKVSNAERVVYPEDGITKGEVVSYYRKIGARMLPYLKDRALTVERYPKGVGGEGFMQKNTPDHYPQRLIRRHQVPREDGGVTTYPVIDSVEAIAYFANLGVIAFHVPLVSVDDVSHPNWAVWDLDPPPGETGRVREAARAVRRVLDDHGIPTVPMTSGSKGYHLRVRIRPAMDGGAVAEMTRGVAELAAAARPDLLTTAFRKRDRGGRVFVDWLRNAPYATAVSPWSLRALPGAPVAVPLSWDELDDVDPDGVRLGEALERPDPWAELAPADLGAAATAVEESIESAGIQLEPFDRFRS